jgi:hypothetical protein
MIASGEKRVNEAAALLRRTAQAEGEGTLAGALLLEQAALAFLQHPKPQLRRHSMHAVLAAESFIECSAVPHAVRVMHSALAAYRSGQKWTLLEDHLLGRLAQVVEHRARPEMAIGYLADLLRTGAEKLSPEAQSVLLLQLERCYASWAESTAAAGTGVATAAPVVEQPALPLIDETATRVVWMPSVGASAAVVATVAERAGSLIWDSAATDLASADAASAGAAASCSYRPCAAQTPDAGSALVERLPVMPEPAVLPGSRGLELAAPMRLSDFASLSTGSGSGSPAPPAAGFTSASHRSFPGSTRAKPTTQADVAAGSPSVAAGPSALLAFGSPLAVGGEALTRSVPTEAGVGEGALRSHVQGVSNLHEPVQAEAVWVAMAEALARDADSKNRARFVMEEDDDADDNGLGGGGGPGGPGGTGVNAASTSSLAGSERPSHRGAGSSASAWALASSPSTGVPGVLDWRKAAALSARAFADDEDARMEGRPDSFAKLRKLRLKAAGSPLVVGQGRAVAVCVRLRNPLAVPLLLRQVRVCCDVHVDAEGAVGDPDTCQQGWLGKGSTVADAAAGGNARALPVTVTLPPRSSTTVPLLAMPTSPGTLRVTGVQFRLGTVGGGVCCRLPLTVRGLPKADTPDDRVEIQRYHDARLQAIVAADAPGLDVSVAGLERESMPMLEGEVRRVRLTITNRSSYPVGRITVATPASAAGVTGPVGAVHLAREAKLSHATDDEALTTDQAPAPHTRRAEPLAPLYAVPVPVPAPAHAPAPAAEAAAATTTGDCDCPNGPMRLFGMSAGLFALGLGRGGLEPGTSTQCDMLVRAGQLQPRGSAHGVASLRLLLQYTETAESATEVAEARAKLAAASSGAASSRQAARASAPNPRVAALRWCAEVPVASGPQHSTTVRLQDEEVADAAPASSRQRQRELSVGLCGHPSSTISASLLIGAGWAWTGSRKQAAAAPSCIAGVGSAPRLPPSTHSREAADLCLSLLQQLPASEGPAVASGAGVVSTLVPLSLERAGAAVAGTLLSEASDSEALLTTLAHLCGSFSPADGDTTAALSVGEAVLGLLRQESAAASFARACAAEHKSERAQRRAAAAAESMPRSLQEIRLDKARKAEEARRLAEAAARAGGPQGDRTEQSRIALLDDAAVAPVERAGELVLAGGADGHALVARGAEASDSSQAESARVETRGATYAEIPADGARLVGVPAMSGRSVMPGSVAALLGAADNVTSLALWRDASSGHRVGASMVRCVGMVAPQRASAVCGASGSATTPTADTGGVESKEEDSLPGFTPTPAERELRVILALRPDGRAAPGQAVSVRVVARLAGAALASGAELEPDKSVRVRLGMSRGTAAAAGARLEGGQVSSIKGLRPGVEATWTVRLSVARAGSWDLSSVFVARAESWPPAAGLDGAKPDRGEAVPVLFAGRAVMEARD